MSETQKAFAEALDTNAGGYRASQVLLAANEVNLFSFLGTQLLDIDELSSLLETDTRATRILCDALVSLSLLKKEGLSYRNTEDGLQFLCADSPESHSAMLLHMNRLYQSWGHLSQTLRSGKPAPKETVSEQAPKSRHQFAQAMAVVGRTLAEQTADALSLNNIASALDVGGGPGLYSIAFAKNNPQLHVVIIDDEDTLFVAKRNAENAGLSERISFLPGNILEDELSQSFDLIFVSNVVHMFSEEQNRKLIKQAAKALNPGGRICLKDFFLEPCRTSPEWSALFAVNMLVNTEQGDCYTIEQASQWFKEAGLSLQETISLTPRSILLIGKEPH